MQTFLEGVAHLQGSKLGSLPQSSELYACLKFAIDPQTIGLIESEFIQEVLTIKATQVMPVPNKPSCIVGILSRRRRVYWAVDLAMLLGLQPLDQNIGLYEVILASVQQLSVRSSLNPF